MKPLLLIVLIQFNLILFSQDCKYKKNDVDKFTKSHIIETKSKCLYDQFMPPTESMCVYGKKIDSLRYLKVMFSSAGSFHIQESSELMFVLYNGDVITLKSLSDEIPDFTLVSGLTVGSVTITYPIYNFEYEKLCTWLITDVRIYTSEGYVERKILEDKADVLANILKCIK